MQEKGRVVYWNGEFIPEQEARISIYDSALMFGDMIFEMTRSFNKKHFKLRQHLERLYTGIKILRVPISMTIDEMEEAVYRTVEANEPVFADDDEHRVMIDVSRGLLSLYQGVVGIPPGPNVIIADFPLRWTVAGCGHLYDEGIKLVISSQRAIPAHLIEPKIKNRSRLFYLMANIEVSNYKGSNNWALLLDPDGFIAEGTGSNFFMVKDNVIYTPEGRNILRGITRATVMDDLALKLGIRCVEKNLETYDVYTADEVFLTSTPFCILPATYFNGVPIGDGKPGEITRLLLNTWSKIAGLDIVEQIKGWDKKEQTKDPNAPSPYQFKAR
ncbi:MAG: aminotransferase class IV [Candidatus Omnitrophica bacterium]|nr:aminotransferase class IV [Candidatus Omnitrophota bacterium]